MANFKSKVEQIKKELDIEAPTLELVLKKANEMLKIEPAGNLVDQANVVLTQLEVDPEARDVSVEQFARMKEQAHIVKDIASTKAQLQPFLAEIEKMQTDLEGKTSAAKEQIVETVKARLKSMKGDLEQYDVALPDAIQTNDVDQCLTNLQAAFGSAVGQLDKVDAGKSVAVRKLIKQDLKLLAGILLSKDGADRVAPDGLQIRLGVNCEEQLLSRDVDPSYERSEEWMSSSRSAQMKAWQTNMGSSFSKAASASGAGFVGGGVAAFSAHAAQSEAHEDEEASNNASQTSRLKLTRQFKVFKSVAALDINPGQHVQVSDQLQGALSPLTLRIHQDLGDRTPQGIYEALKHDVRALLTKFGSHFRIKVQLGGVLTNEVVFTSTKAATTSMSFGARASEAADAVSAAGGYAGLGGGFKAGYAYDRSDGSATGERDVRKEASAKSQFSSMITAHGGAESNKEHPALWRQSLKSNDNWRAVRVDTWHAVWEGSIMDTFEASMGKPRIPEPDFEAARNKLAHTMELVWVRDLMGYPDLSSVQELQDKLGHLARMREQIEQSFLTDFKRNLEIEQENTRIQAAMPPGMRAAKKKYAGFVGSKLKRDKLIREYRVLAGLD